MKREDNPLRGMDCAHGGCRFAPVVLKDMGGGVQNPYCGYHDPDKRLRKGSHARARDQRARELYRIREKAAARRFALSTLDQAGLALLKQAMQAITDAEARSAFTQGLLVLEPDDLDPHTCKEGPCEAMVTPDGERCGEPGIVTQPSSVRLCPKHGTEKGAHAA